MNQDLRTTPLYLEVEEFFRRAFEPAFGRISGATDPHPSPDGRLIAFTGSKLERLEGLPISRICVANAAGGTFDEVTNGPNDDRLPRWSPDGSTLAFLSDRAEKGTFQLYLLRDRLGEAGLPAHVEGSVEHFSWSADGRSILMGVAGSGAELAGVEGSGTTKEETSELPTWIPQTRSSSDREGWRRAWVLDMATESARPVSREGLNVWECVWCGRDAIAAIVSDGPGEELWYTARLVLIDPESGKERELYRGSQQLGWPAASPTGQRLAVVDALSSDRWVVAGDVVLLDPNGGEPRRPSTQGVDVTALSWRDDDHLLFAGLRGMQSVMGELDAATGEAREVWATDESWGFVYPDLNPAPGPGLAAVGVLQGYDRFPELAVLEEGGPRTIVSLEHEGSRSLREHAGQVEHIAWTAPDGLEIEGLLVRPDGTGPYPLVVMVHGGPVAATVNRWAMRGIVAPLLVSRGFAVLYPNPRGSSGKGQAFAEMVYGDMGGGDADDIVAGVDALVERGVADPARVGIGGGSYGGFMSCWLPTQSDKFAAAVAISPVTDWFSQHLTSNIGFWDRQILNDRLENPGGQYLARSPIAHAHRSRTPTLLTAGLEDRCTPPGQAVEFFRALEEHGIDAELALYAGEGHGVRKLPAAIDLVTRTVAWFERHMAPSSLAHRTEPSGPA